MSTPLPMNLPLVSSVNAGGSVVPRIIDNKSVIYVRRKTLKPQVNKNS